MRKIGVFLLSLAMLVGLIPQTAFAAQDAEFEQEYSQYLSDVSSERGFEVTREDVEESLATYELSLEDVSSVESLNSVLGKVIASDNSNLGLIYASFGLTYDSLTQLLNEHGEELSDYVYLNNLLWAVNYYITGDEPSPGDSFEQNLEAYLGTVSEERGFTVTRQDLEASLAIYGMSLDDFNDVGNLGEYLGDVIKSDLSNLDYFNDAYELDEQSLLKLLTDHNDDINNYVYISDLEVAVISMLSDGDTGFDMDSLAELFKAFGVSDEEVQNIADYFKGHEDYFSDPATIEIIDAALERLVAAAEAIGTGEEVTKDQITELLNAYNDLFAAVKMNVTFFVVKDDQETAVTLAELIEMDSIDDADLKVALYGTDSQLLADFVIEGEDLADPGDVIDDNDDKTGNDNDKDDDKKPGSNKTEKGGKMPKTATNYIPYTLIGLATALAGILAYRRLRNVGSENTR